MAVTLKTLRVHITHADGTTPALGVVTISSTYALRDAANAVVHGPVFERLVLDEDAAGVATVQLPATDDPALTPSGWTYTVCVDTDAWRQVMAIEIPFATSGTLQLAAVAPAVSAPAVVTYALASQLTAYLPKSGGTLTGALALAGAPTQDLHPATKLYVDQAVAGVGGGGLDEEDLAGLARKPVIRDAYITSGNVDPMPNTAGGWVELPGFEITIPATVGDRVDIDLHAMRNSTETSYLDVAVKVGNTLVRYLASGTDQPAIEGDPGWYPGSYPAQSGPRGFTVEAGHLDSGLVRFVLICKAIGTGVLFASTAFPFYWRAENSGPTD